MTHLNAFVGHSFSAEDEAVIGRLLSMLNSIQALMPDFDWDHAQAAEPKELSDKVREKMQDKNLFIGICTARENVLPPGALRSHWWLPRGCTLAEKTEVHIKASDWVIQEIGMAVGRNMSIVVLLEDGVRKPGGLQGDLEYIPFKRESPELCLDKVVSMLRTLSPRIATSSETQNTAAAGASGVPAATSVDTPTDVSWAEILSPDATWTAIDYIAHYRLAIRFKEGEAQKRIHAAFTESPFNANEQSRIAFLAAGIAARGAAYKEEWQAPLDRLKGEHSTCYGPYLALADRYAAINEHELAGLNFETAAQFAQTSANKLAWLAQAAEHCAKSGLVSRAEPLLGRSVELIREEGELEIDGLGSIASIWLELGNTDIYYATAERYLELAPDKGPLRFALASKYGAIGRDADALFHYRQYIQTQQENSGAYNNVGVAADTLKLPVTAIDGYLKAEETGNSLATSNRVYALLGAGFVDDAIKVCEDALNRPNPDPRVSEARAKAQRTREEEHERETRLISDTAARRKLFRHMGQATLRKAPDLFPEMWRGPEFILSAKLNGESLSMVGTYMRDKGALLSSLLGFGGTTKEEVRVEYSGRLYGLAFVGFVVTQPTNSTPASASLLGGKEDKKDCVGYLDASGRKFEILEAGARFYTLTTVQAEQ
jgi:hypothetical protein